MWQGTPGSQGRRAIAFLSRISFSARPSSALVVTPGFTAWRTSIKHIVEQRARFTHHLRSARSAFQVDHCNVLQLFGDGFAEDLVVLRSVHGAQNTLWLCRTRSTWRGLLVIDLKATQDRFGLVVVALDQSGVPSSSQTVFSLQKFDMVGSAAFGAYPAGRITVRSENRPAV